MNRQQQTVTTKPITILKNKQGREVATILGEVNVDIMAQFFIKAGKVK